MDADHQAAVVVVADVLAHGRDGVMLQGRPLERSSRMADNLGPVLPGGCLVGRFVDRDAEPQPTLRNPAEP
jgi:hypothetical protein